MLSEHMTPILQRNANIALDLYSKFMGLRCKIYYAKSVGHYSGSNDDMVYNKDPDTEMDLLIPDLFNLCRSSIAGIMDNVFQNEFKLYLKHDQYLPEFTKIVYLSPVVGVLQYTVQESDAQHTPNGQIYKELTIAPFSNYANNDSKVNEVILDLAQADEKMLEDNGMVNTDPISESDVDRSKSKYGYTPVKAV